MFILFTNNSTIHKRVLVHKLFLLDSSFFTRNQFMVIFLQNQIRTRLKNE